MAAASGHDHGVFARARVHACFNAHHDQCNNNSTPFNVLNCPPPTAIHLLLSRRANPDAKNVREKELFPRCDFVTFSSHTVIL